MYTVLPWGSTALDIAEWRAARRAKRKKHALQKRWRAAAGKEILDDMKALLELCR